MMILIFGVHIILRTRAGRVRYGLCLLMQLRHLVVAPRSLARTPPSSLLASSPGPFQDPSDPLCSANACLEARSDPPRAARTPRLLRTTKICPPQTSLASSHPPSAWGDASRFSGVSECRGSGSLVTITGKLLGEPSLGNLFHGGWLREGLGDHRWRPLRNLRQGSWGPAAGGALRPRCSEPLGPRHKVLWRAVTGEPLRLRRGRATGALSRTGRWGPVAGELLGARR